MAGSEDSLSSISRLVLREGRSTLFLDKNPLVDHPFEAAASLGLGLAIVRWLWSSSRRPAIQNDEDEVVVVKSGFVDAILNSIRRSLRRLLLDPEELQQYEADHLIDDVHVADGAMITHQGSCHCHSVRFEVRAPRTLIAKEGPGKINYRHMDVKSSHMRVTRGQGYLKTYYVQTAKDRGAHAFCERCGCHILYAPSKNSDRLLVNVNCIDDGIRKIKVVDSKSTSLSNGFAMDTQWDALSTISEISQEPLRIKQTPFHSDSLSVDGSTDWRLYDEVDRLDPTGPRSYYQSPRTLTTVDTDTYSLPALRLPRGASDSNSIATESDIFSVTQSEFPMAVSTPAKSLPQLRDQMKYYMKKHSSPPTLKTETRKGASSKSRENSAKQTAS